MHAPGAHDRVGRQCVDGLMMLDFLYFLKSRSILWFLTLKNIENGFRKKWNWFHILYWVETIFIILLNQMSVFLFKWILQTRHVSTTSSARQGRGHDERGPMRTVRLNMGYASQRLFKELWIEWILLGRALVLWVCNLGSGNSTTGDCCSRRRMAAAGGEIAGASSGTRTKRLKIAVIHPDLGIGKSPSSTSGRSCSCFASPHCPIWDVA
jgi:hypothetical protein